MRILWSLPVRGERLSSSRGDMVRARHLVGALRALGHEVCVVEASEQAAADLSVTAYRQLVRRALPQRVACAMRDVGRWLHGRAHGKRVAQQARLHKADVIIETHVNFSMSGAVAARATGLPLVLDDCSPSAEEKAFGPGLHRLATHALQRQAESASVLAASSESLCRRLVEEGVPDEKLIVVPNGIDPGAFDAGSREDARAGLGVSDRCVLGFVGSFQPWHQVELLMQAVALLADRYPLHLLLVGDGPGREPALAEARRAGLADCVTLTGAVNSSEVPRLLAAFDIGVLPASNDYGQPMKLMEYGAAGLASVAPDLAPVREVLRHGVNGLLFPSGDVNGLASALATLIADGDLRRRMGAEARAEVIAGASWADRARRLDACVRGFVANGEGAERGRSPVFGQQGK